MLGEQCAIWPKTKEPNPVLDWTWSEAVASKLPTHYSSEKVVLYPVTCPGTCSHTAGDVPPLSGAKPISILLERALQRGSKTPAQCCEEQTEALWGCPWEGAFAGPRNGRHVRSGRQRSQGSPLSPLSIVQNKHRWCIWM